MLCWPGWNWTLKKAFWILHWIRVLLQIPEFSRSWDHFQFLRLHQVFQVIKLLESHRCSITSHSVTLYQSTKYLSSIWWNNPDVLVRCEYVIILLTRVFLLDLFNWSGFCPKVSPTVESRQTPSPSVLFCFFDDFLDKSSLDAWSHFGFGLFLESISTISVSL